MISSVIACDMLFLKDSMFYLMCLGPLHMQPVDISALFLFLKDSMFYPICLNHKSIVHVVTSPTRASTWCKNKWTLIRWTINLLYKKMWYTNLKRTTSIQWLIMCRECISTWQCPFIKQLSIYSNDIFYLKLINKKIIIIIFYVSSCFT